MIFTMLKSLALPLLCIGLLAGFSSTLNCGGIPINVFLEEAEKLRLTCLIRYNQALRLDIHKSLPDAQARELEETFESECRGQNPSVQAWLATMLNNIYNHNQSEYKYRLFFNCDQALRSLYLLIELIKKIRKQHEVSHVFLGRDLFYKPDSRLLASRDSRLLACSLCFTKPYNPSDLLRLSTETDDTEELLLEPAGDDIPLYGSSAIPKCVDHRPTKTDRVGRKPYPQVDPSFF